MMKRLYDLSALGLCIGVLALVGGCGSDGPEIAEVEGQVLMDGQPLPDATVTFEPAGGRSSLGRTDEEGRFELRYSSTESGALVGDHAVRISTFEPQRPAGPSGELTELKPELVQEKYNTETELTATVESGWSANEFVFELDPMQPKR